MTKTKKNFNEVHWRFKPKSGVTRDLVKNVVRLEYGDIPSEIIELAKGGILDALGCMLAGSIQGSSQKVLKFARSQGGVTECTVAYYGDSTNRYQAALVNGAFCHGWEFDDATEYGMSCESVVVPSALAVAEKELLEGHRVLTAVVLGWETICRIGAAATWVPVKRPLHPISTFGPFGAAVATGKLLGFREFDMENAISLCTGQAAATLQTTQTGGDIARLHGGFAGSYGVRCAYMARERLSGAREILEGNMGFFSCVCGLRDDDKTPRYEVEKVNEGFGKKWLMEGVTFKKYPVGEGQLGLIEEITKLRDKNKIKAEEVEEVVIGSNVSSGGWMDSTIRVPREEDVYGAQRSMAWGVGMAMVVGSNDIAAYKNNVPPYGRSAEIAKFIDRVKVVDNEEVNRRGPFFQKITIRLKEGKTIEGEADWPKGNYRHNPMSWEDLEGKFREQAGIAGLCKQKQERVIGMVKELEDVNDVGELMYNLVCG